VRRPCAAAAVAVAPCRRLRAFHSDDGPLSFFLLLLLLLMYVRVLVHRPHLLMDINSFAMALPLDNSKY
jgi:hypothetical protein